MFAIYFRTGCYVVQRQSALISRPAQGSANGVHTASAIGIIHQLGTYRSGSISVVVVNWNRRDLLRACLRSLAAQQTAHPFDVVVVDNGSDDGSPEMVLEEFPGGQSLRVQLARKSTHVGFCA